MWRNAFQSQKAQWPVAATVAGTACSTFSHGVNMTEQQMCLSHILESVLGLVVQAALHSQWMSLHSA